MLPGTNTRLRSLERDDLDRCHSWLGDPDVRRYLLMYLPLSRAQEEAWLDSLRERINSGKEVLFAIETQQGEHIGNIGFHGIDWKNRSAELGIMIGEKSRWGQGYGTDAIRTMLRLGFEEMNLHRISLNVDVDNKRAIACYEKCGLRHDGTIRDAIFKKGRFIDQKLMSILSSDPNPES